MKQIYINSLLRETRVTYVEDGKPVEYLIERPLEKRMIGNVYKGKVANVLPGMQAAFVDIGYKKNAFLYVDDLIAFKRTDREETSQSVNIQDLVQTGDEIMIQVSKEAVGSKGPKVTTNLSLPGRYLVYLPQGRHVGISRRIEDEMERERLKDIGERLIREEEGLIVRTKCVGVSEDDLVQDLNELRALWENIQKKAHQATAPQMIHQELDIIPKIVRDLLTIDIDECFIDDKEQYERLKQEMSPYPELQEKLRLYTGKQHIFDYYNITSELDKALRRKVWLKSGGYIIVDHTEALTAIDVNTGKFIGKRDLEQTVLKTNLEAAKEIARQLRLRDIGGIIIVDFIDMTDSAHQHAVLQELQNEVKRDRTKTVVVGLTSLGLVEMTRKKMRENVLEVLSKPCSYCEGKGYTLKEESVASKVEQMLLEYHTLGIEALLIEMHPNVAEKLFETPAHARWLEEKCGCKLFIHSHADVHIEHYSILYAGTVHQARKRLAELQGSTSC